MTMIVLMVVNYFLPSLPINDIVASSSGSSSSSSSSACTCIIIVFPSVVLSVPIASQL